MRPAGRDNSGMRKALAALAVLAVALLVAPAPSATSATSAPGGADRARTTQASRVVSVRDRVIQITNNKRAAHGCNPLRKKAPLMRAAQAHSKKMADYFATHTWDPVVAHQVPGEAGLGSRFTAAGYRGWTMAGENVAYGYTTASQVMNGWMHSQVHRANILNCRFKHIGVGFVRAADGTPYWTQDFGRR